MPRLAVLALATIAVSLPASRVLADLPPTSVVTTEVITPGQKYSFVNVNSEGWFDVGGFCKVVDVGDLSFMNPPGKGIPVFITGPADQWENWRTRAPNSPAYHGQVTSTTCCRPQSNITTLCASGSNPTAVGRQYGRLGETDTVAVSCAGPYGEYTESVTLTCTGDNGPDGQATWTAGGDSDVCAPNAQTNFGTCSTAGVGGWGTQSVTVLDSCGQVQSSSSQSCYVQPPCTPNWQATACNMATGERTFYDTNNCPGDNSYTLGPPASGCSLASADECVTFIPTDPGPCACNGGDLGGVPCTDYHVNDWLAFFCPSEGASSYTYNMNSCGNDTCTHCEWYQ